MSESRQKKVVVELPEASVRFFEEYASNHGVTVAELVERYIQQLQSTSGQGAHPTLKEISGTVPKEVNVWQSYQDYLLEKYR